MKNESIRVRPPHVVGPNAVLEVVLRWTAAPMVIGLSILASPASSQDIVLTIPGNHLEGLGPVAAIGDIDSDGVIDLVLGAPGRNKVRVCSGSTGQVLLEVIGTNSGFGYAVAGVGDFNLDGVPDFCVSAPDDSTAGLYRGAVRVYDGATGALLAAVYGQFSEERLGRRLAGLGDLNQDGYPEFGAAPWMHRQVRIYTGPNAQLLRTHGLGTGNTTRPSIDGVGDVNGDGVPDYVIGWPQESTAGSLTGTAAVFSGRNGTLLRQVFGPIATGGGLTGSHLGASVAGVGDIDGDGIPDFAAGAPGCVDITFETTQGLARVYSGATAAILWEWDSLEYVTTQPSGQFGFYVAGGGDLNGDGYPEVMVGAPQDGGTSRGIVSVFSGRTGERIWRLRGSSTASRMYFSAGVGDLDGDGLVDFATGDQGADIGGTSTGLVTVYAGSLGDLDRHCRAEGFVHSRTMRLSISGALGIGNNFLRLRTFDAPPGGIAFFFYGPPTPPAPLAGGLSCTGPPSFALSAPLPVSPTGFVECILDFTLPPLSDGPGAVQPGSTWSFQLLCRDPSPQSTGPRISEGLSILFPP